MSEAKFTPGPWVVGYKSLTVGIPENAKIGGFEKLFDVRGWGYFTGLGHGALRMSAEDAIAIQDANAHLIAAAPELYEASEPFDELATQQAVDSPEWRDSDSVRVVVTIGTLRAIKAALAKARGEV